MTRELTNEDGEVDASGARGRVVPRESDERKLNEWADRLDNGGSNGVA